MWTTKVKDALAKGEQDVQKVLADIGKDAPKAEAVLETVVTILAPAEANALNTVINAASGIVSAFGTANTAAVAAGQALGANPQLDGQFVSDVKALVADIEAALKSLKPGN